MRRLCCCLSGLGSKGRDFADGDDGYEDSERVMEARGLTGAAQGKAKLGPLEVAERLKHQTVFHEASLVRHVREHIEDVPSGRSTPTASPSSLSTPSPTPRGKMESRMICDYLDTLASAKRTNEYTLVVKGPLRKIDASVPEEERDALLAKELDNLESLLLDESDARRFQLVGVKLCEVDVRYPVTSFANNLLTSGSVESFSLVSCIVLPTVLQSGLHICRSSSLTYLSLKSCALSDPHMTCLVTSFEGSPLLRNLSSLHLTGSFTPATVDRFISVLEEEASQLKALSFPRRHEVLIKQHGISSALPHLILNGKRVRHVLQ